MNHLQASAIFVLLVCSSVVEAQTGLVRTPESVSLSFFYGALHPLTVTHHLLVLLAMGLLAGRQHQNHVDKALIIGLACIAIGLVLAPQSVIAFALVLMLALSLLASFLVVINKAAASWLALPIVGVACLVLGLDSPADPNQPFAHRLASQAGTWLGASAPIIYLSLLARNATKPWQTIAVRIGASWLSAVAMVVLVLKLTRTSLPG
ncbi:MAG: HupE/UreJ family protein [Burkholderiaceae bacterium]